MEHQCIHRRQTVERMGGVNMVENTKALFAQRAERLTKAFKHEIPDRVPITLMLETWAGHYAGNTIVDVGYDYEKLKESIFKVAEDFPEIDALPPAFGIRPGNVYAAAASREFRHYDDDGEPYASVQHTEAGDVMLAEEYDELIADPFKFIIEKQIPRRYAAFDKSGDKKAMAMGMMATSFATYMNEGIAAVGGGLATEYGMPTLFKGSTEMALDVLMDYFRGFNNIMMDIRRRKDKVIAAAEAMHPLMLRRAAQGVESGPFPAIFIPLHIPTYLKPKDFETFYFPTFRKMIDTLISYDMTPMLFMEGDWEPYFDFINELPKKKVVGLIETGDFKKYKDGIGDTICLTGGMSVDLINHGTKQEVIDHTKYLIDTLAPGGGYIFCLDKSLLAPKDANAENLKAAFETVTTYGVYK
jgi:uroporphyrinogen-III decarboxylase